MKREISGFCRNCILNLGINNPSWDIKVTESQPIKDYQEYSITTDASRHEGIFEPYQIRAFMGLADGLGLNFAINLNKETQEMEFILN